MGATRDTLDLRILDLLQRDALLTADELAERLSAYGYGDCARAA
ncbi:winged helix-turn-helix transcriptional regulator [Sphingomonas sp. Root241]|nr:winged helix-turn-helix domain-containing protein [Sphingomonas sp. Root241]